MTSTAAEGSKRAKAGMILAAVDFAGTFLFGIEGALSAMAAHLDLFGALVLSFCTALGGGIIRDVLIGSMPPGSIRDWRYGALAFTGGGSAIFLYQFVERIPPMLLITLDAGGLALFAVAGAAKAVEYGINPFIAILMGTITGVGGGTIRDMLLARIPIVLRADVYATAAMLGAAIFVAATASKMPSRWAAILGGASCFALRMVAVMHHWNLPVSMAY